MNMQKQEKSRKPLIIGVIAAVVVLAVVLALLLTQCVGGGTGATTDPSATAGSSTEVPTYELYWNADRAEYDGKSEAGMSSRMPESDGYFHVRFILDGEEVVLKVADRKLINAIDVKDLMGLEFDENGIVIDVIDIEDMPLEKLGWQFYVQSAAKTLIKLNSSEGMNGMEVLLETDENTGIYDMTGLSGPVGVTADPINLDRVYAVANLAGDVTHVFIYQRPNYMLTHEGECEHCKKTVTWYEWTKTDSLPLTTGHYQLQNDIQLNGQPAQQEDAKVCLDLNGKRVDGKSGSRCYAMFNAGTELAIMDTSEGQTGVMAAHGKGDQGMVVWVRYGAFYLYGGTLDASDAITKLNGTAVECGNGKYFYMYGGTIIGGKAEPQKNDKGNWTNGLGGAMSIGGKFVMNGGEIRDGYAESKVTWKNGEPTYNRGFGGNIYAGSTAVIELNGGVIKNGRAGNTGGNIYLDGSAELTINGGKIQGGTITGKGRNGGSIFAGAKTKIVLSSGSVSGGTCRNCGGNIYTNGVLTMTGGSIYGGTIRNYTTGKVTENAASANIFVVNGRFLMYGGKIDGGVQLIDTSATDNKDTYCYLTTHAVIDGGKFNTRSLTLSSGGSGITVSVGKMRDDARVGVHATTGIFTLPTLEENKDNFFSSIEGADIVYHDGCLGLGRVQCVCGKDAHFGACDGTTYVFAPWESKSSLPNGTGKYYLLNDVKMTGTTSVVTQGDGVDVEVVLDLNGKNVKKAGGSSRVYSLFENKVSLNPDGTYAGNIEGEGVHVTLTDSAGTAVVDLNTIEDGDQGLLLWGRYNDSKINIYGGTYVGTNVNSKRHSGVIISTSGELNIYGGTFDGGNSTSAGGIISVSGSKAVFNLYGGVIKNGTATHSGGNINVASGATMNMYGGTVTAGSVNKDSTLVGDLGYGGNIVVAGTLNMYGGEITDGLVKIGLAGQKADGTKISAGGGLAGNLQVNGTANLMGGVIRDGRAGTGGNIGTNNSNATIILDGVQVLDGVATGSGGNIAINVRAAKLLEIKGNTLVSGGTAAASGGNIYANAWAANSKDINITIAGGTIENGTAATKGGNVYMHNTTSGDTAGKNVLTMTGGTISGGKLTNTANNGGSIYLESKSEFVLDGGTVTGGSGAKQGGNFYLANSTGKLTVNGGEILNGHTNDCGGNVQLQGGSTLVVNGGKILDGHHDNGGSSPSQNVYAVNSHIAMTGGEINGLAATNTRENGCTVKISGDAVVSPSKSGAGLSLAVYPATATFDTPFIELGELSDKASILMSSGGYVSTKTIQANVNNFTTNVADAGAHFVDERVFIGQVACICGGTSDIGPCAEGGHKTVAWTPWDGARDTMKADTHYYLTKDVTVSTQITLGNSGRPSNVSVNLNGHTMTTTFRVFQMWNSSTMNLADHKGGGAILTKGNTGDNFGGIQMLNTPTVHMYSGKIGFADGYTNHKAVALIEAAGTFNMYGGEIFGGAKPTATLINVNGTFNMYDGIVRDGYNATIDSTNANRGGNFRVAGALNVYGGTITGGQAKYGGNIAATGKVNVYGGTISDGRGYTGEATNYPQGGNIWLTGASAALNVNGKATISGGQLTGSGWMPGGSIYANGKATITIDGGATVIGGRGQDGNNIYLTSDGTTLTLKDCTIENTVDGTGNIMVERGNVIIDGATIINKANGYNLRANETGKVANFTLNSGLVTGGKPNVTLGGDDTFTMNGGTIENGSGTNGGNITIGNSKFTLKNGTIVGGVASGAGGNFALSGASELVIDGGEIKDGTANGGTGGNIVVWDTSVVTLNNGTVSGGTSSGNGGSISLDAKTNMTINGGTVTGGYSGNQGGNFAVYGKLTVKGGLITNGSSKSTSAGMNIAVIASTANQQHELEVTGGTIAGGVYFNNYQGNYAVVKLSGNPVIDKELATANKPGYSLKLSSNDLTIGQLTDGAKIFVSGQEGVFSYKAPEGSAQYFHSEVAGLNVFQTPADELVLVYGKTGCICGSTDGNHIGECDGTPHDWMPVTSLPTTSGYYYLISDVTDSGDQRILTTSQDIYLDLNGKTVTSNKWRMYRFDAACNLTITDNSANRDGKIVVPANRDQGSVVWFFSGNSTFSMYGGVIDVSAAKNNSGSPGLAIAGGSSVVKLFSGKILGGTYDPATNWGGAVAFEGGNVHYMGNVEITGTDSAIFVSNGSILDMSNVTEAPETPWSVNASGIFTKGWNKNWNIADYFTPGTSTGTQIFLDETTGELKMGVMDCTCRQATCICDGEDIFWQPWFSSKDLPSTTGNWYLTRDFSGVSQKGITAPTFTDVKVDLAGHKVTANNGSRVYLVQNTNHLTITDSVGGGVMAGGGSNNNNCGGFLMQGTTVLKLYAGTLTLSETAYTNNTRAGVIEINGSFYMYGGEVTGGTAKAGGNIWSNSTSDIHILGGKVTNGTALYNGTETTYGKGGNIFVSGANSVLEIGGKAEISGGTATTTISGKAGWAPGGNIYAENGAQVTVNGGTIKNGKASDGHNIYMTGAATTVTLKDVTVENTSTTSSSIVVEAGTLNVEDGALIKNTVAGARNISTNNSGDNVGTINIKGGTVTGGHSGTANGGNILINANDFMTVSGGVIENGVSENQAGNISIHGTVTISGGTIRNGKAKADGDGHNICVTSPAADQKANLTISGGEIAGGIVFNCFYDTPNVKLSGNPVINKALTSADAAAKPGFGISVPASFDLDVAGLTGGEIHVKGSEAGQFAFNATSGMEKFFVSETVLNGVTLPVCYENGGLCFGQIYCLCGYTKSGTTLNAHESWCDKSNRIWLPWSSASALPTTEGNWYLTQKVTLNDQVFVDKPDNATRNVVIDLNGQNITFNQPVRSDGYRFLVVRYGANVSFTDTSATAGTMTYVASDYSNAADNVKTAMTAGNQGMLFWVWDNSSITLYRGNFDGSAIRATQKDGATAEIAATAKLTMYDATIKVGSIGWSNNIAVIGTLNIHGGEISGGTANNGGNIGVKGTLTMTAGTISGGTATANGGNIRIQAGATVNITGGKVTGGTAVNGGNISIEEGANVTIKDATVSDGVVTAAASHVYGGNIYNLGTLTLDGATVSGGTGKSSGTVGTSKYYSYGGNIHMSGNASLVMKNEAIVTKGVSNSSGLWAPGGNIHMSGKATLDITDSTISEGKGSQANNIYIGTDTTCTLYSGKILNTEDVSSIVMQGSTLNIKGGEITSTAANARNIHHNNEGTKATINMEAGTISGATSKENGANILLGSTGTFNFSDGTISGGTVDRSGEAVDAGYGGSISVAGTMNMYGGTITGGFIRGGQNGGGLGGNIFVSGTLNVTGGTIEKGNASAGGNIGSNSTAAVIRISGATIKDGTATGKGGNICVNVRKVSEVTIGEGTVISGGNTAGSGGNIAIDVWASGANPTNTMTITGATISGGTASAKGGNIYVTGNATYPASIVLKDTTVTGGEGTTDNVGGVYINNANAKLTLDGKVDISGNTGKNLYLNGGAVVTVNALTSGSKIGVSASADGVISNVIDAAEAAYFTCENADRNVIRLEAPDADAGKLYIGQLHCICGKIDGSCTTYTDASGNKVGCDGKAIKWTAWTSNNSVPTAAGNYYLTQDVTISKNTGVSANVVLDLNGHTITVTAERLYNPNGTNTVTITNSVKGEGGIVINGSVFGGAMAEINAGATMNLYNVTVSMTGGQASYSGGLVNLKGTLNMFGDTVLEGGKTAPGINGGNMGIIEGAVLNMYDGIIRDGVATRNNGGGEGGNMQCWGIMNVYGDAVISNAAMNYGSGNIQLCGNSAVLNLYGGTITGDFTYYQTPTVNVYADAKITKGANRGMPIVSGVVINIKEDRTGKDPIAVTQVNGTAPYAFAQGSGITLSYEAKSWFAPTDGKQIGFFEDGMLYVVDEGAHMHCECGNSLKNGTKFEDGSVHNCADLIYTTYTAQSGSMDADRNWYLTGDFNLDGQYSTNGHSLNLCLNGYNVYGTNNNRMFRTFGGGSMVFTTCQPNSDKNSLVPTNSSNGKAVTDGGAIWVTGSGSYAKTYGITLDASNYILWPEVNTANKTVSAKNGAAVHLSAGTSMVAYNTTVKGGTVQYRSETFDDGTKDATSLGSAIMLDNNTTYKMYGGSVEGGTYHDDTSGDIHMGTAVMHLIGEVSFAPKTGKTAIYMNEGGKLDVTYLTAVNAPISVNAVGAFATDSKNTVSSKVAFFTSSVNGVNVFAYNNELFAGLYSCVCGQEEHTDGCVAYNNSEKLAWSPVRSATMDKTAGNWYLIHDVTTNSGGVNPNNLLVNLNGHTIRGTTGTRVFSFRSRESKTLLITDTSSTDVAKQGKVKSLSNGTSTNQGSIIWMGTPVSGEYNRSNKIYILGGNLDASEYTTSSDGTAILIQGETTGANLYLYGGKIIGGKCVPSVKNNGDGTTTTTNRNGGAIYLGGASNNNVYMYGGTIDGGESYTGGAVYISGSNTFTMNDGVITGGNTTNKGGNVGVSTGEFIMNGGLITGGISGDCGGNVWVGNNGILTMTDGKITDGTHNGDKTSDSANLFVVDGTLDMSGGEITGHAQFILSYNTPDYLVKLSGEAKIADGTTNGLFMTRVSGVTDIPFITVAGLTDNANVVVTLNSSVYTSGTVFAKEVLNSDMDNMTIVPAFTYSSTRKELAVE